MGGDDDDDDDDDGSGGDDGGANVQKTCIGIFSTYRERVSKSHVKPRAIQTSSDANQISISKIKSQCSSSSSSSSSSLVSSSPSSSIIVIIIAIYHIQPH